MVREELQKRRVEPSPVLQSKFASALLEFSAAFLKSDSFKHALTKGEERERPVRDFFEDHLPACYQVVGGEVIDSRDNQSPQLDVMIFDGDRNFAFYSEDACILPAEALLVSVEVKSTLTKQELTKSYVAAKKLYDLRPFGKAPEVAHFGGGARVPGLRYFHTVFAYATDLTPDDWAQKELSRAVTAANETGANPDLIARIYVAGRGFLNIPSNLGVSESSGSANALMHYYMDVLNFLVRENGRRDAAEYTSYAGKLTNGLQHLSRDGAAG